MEELEESVYRYIQFIKGEDYHEDKIDNYKNEIFEKAVEHFYSPEVWDFIKGTIDAKT